MTSAQTILFSGHDLKFLRGFVAHCASDSRYRVLVDEHPGHRITHPSRCQELLPAADVIFCEWCLGNAVWYSQHKRAGQRLIIRLHHQEMELPYRHELEWDRVDSIIFTNLPHYERFCREQAEQRTKAVVIYCDVDCSALDQEKLPGAEFNLGMVGINPMRKRPDLALGILATLREVDSRYTLCFKTRWPWEYRWLWDRPAERAYYERWFAAIESSPYRTSVIFDPHGDDMPSWYAKIGFILSTSDHEGSHQAVAEGMAAGCIPIIRNWNGATPLYPTPFVFSGVEEAGALVREYRTRPAYAVTAARAQAYAREHFHRERIFAQLEALFEPRPGRVRSGRVGWEAAPSVLVLAYLPPDSRGGYRIRVEQEIQALARRGPQVHLVCLHAPDVDPAALEAHVTQLAALGSKVHPLPVAGFFDPAPDEARVRPVLDALQRICVAQRLRLVHAEALYCARLGLLLKERDPSIRLVFDCHGTSPEEEALGGAHPVRISAMREWERRVLAGADLHVFVSEAMRQFYREQYGDHGVPQAIVPCCVADERFPGRRAASRLTGLPARHPVLAYLGTLAEWQCGSEMLRLFAQLARADDALFFLLLVPESDHPKARTLLARADLPETRVLLAELPHSEIPAALQHAHAGVLLRRAHPVNRVSSPTKFGEYLAAGVPTLLTDGIGDFSRAAEAAGVGLVLRAELLDTDTWPAEETDRILEFIHASRRHRARTARACRTFARERLHWDAGVTALLRGYQALDRAGAPTPARPGTATRP